MDALSRSPKVWIIDDANLDSIIIKLSIEKINQDASVIIISNGKEALNKFVELASIKSARLPDVILLDLNMPGMSGWEILTQLKTLSIAFLNHIQVFIVSGRISTVDAKKAESDPFVTNYFHKPIDLDILKSIFEIGRPQ